MFSVLLVIFIRGIEAFEVPALVGVPAKISVFTTKIFLAIHQFPSDFGLAGAYAVTLLLISTTGVLIYGRITRREDRYATVTGKGYRPRVIDLGGWKYVTCAISFLIFLLAVILPVFVLLWSSFIPYYGVPSRELMGKMTWANFHYILNYPLALTAFKNSFYLSVGSATVVMLLTSVIACRARPRRAVARSWGSWRTPRAPSRSCICSPGWLKAAAARISIIGCGSAIFVTRGAIRPCPVSVWA